MYRATEQRFQLMLNTDVNMTRICRPKTARYANRSWKSSAVLIAAVISHKMFRTLLKLTRNTQNVTAMSSGTKALKRRDLFIITSLLITFVDRQEPLAVFLSHRLDHFQERIFLIRVGEPQKYIFDILVVRKSLKADELV